MRRVVIKNASITFLSRILGFSRDMLMAQYIGVSIELDAFLIVFKLPNFFRRLLADGVFSQSLLPALVKAENKVLFLQHVYSVLWLIIVVISFPFIVYPDQVLSYFVYGLDPSGETFILACKLLPWVFPYLGCMSCCGFYVVQLNLQKQYEVGSVLPVALNVLWIMGIIAYGYNHDIASVAISVFIAGLVQVAYCMYRVYRIGGVLFPYLRDEAQALRELMRQVSYGLMAQMVTYASSILELLLVSFLATGSLSWLYYAERLVFLPIGVVSVVLANIVLTDLTQACQSKDMSKVSGILQKSSRWVLLTSFPSMVGGFFLADNIVALLFGSIHFQWSDVMACAQGFRVMALAIPFLMMVRVWNVVPYAFSKPQYLLKMTCKSFFISTLVTLLFLFKLQHVAICLGMLVGGVSNAYQLHGYISQSVSSEIIDMRLAERIVFASMMMAMVLKIANMVWPITFVLTKFELMYVLFLKSGIAIGVWLAAMRSFNVNWQVLFD